MAKIVIIGRKLTTNATMRQLANLLIANTTQYPSISAVMKVDSRISRTLGSLKSG